MERRPKYSGGIETRAETDSDTFETERMRRSAEKLKRTGVLVPAAGKKFYHGRAHEGDRFAVDPFFNNSGNTTGNHNINKGETVLHIASHDTAKAFAEARARRKGSTAEIVEIEIPDQEASFFDCDRYEDDIGGGGRNVEKAREAFMESFPDPVTNTIFSLEDYKTIDHRMLDNLIKYASKYPVIPEKEISEYAKKLNISEAGARAVIGSINVRSTIHNSSDPHATMSRNIMGMLDQRGDVTVPVTVANPVESGPRTMYCPINREYIHQWMRNEHIIGIKCSVFSATLGRPLNDTYEVFSLEEVKGREQMEEARSSRMRIFGGAALRVHQLLNRPEAKRGETPLRYVNMERLSTPSELIDSAKRVSPRYKQLFEGSAGVKEGLTIEQHTETALRLFDASYKSNLPRSVFDLGRLCLLVHDIGKSAANRDGGSQDDYNRYYSKEFLTSIGVPKELTNTIPDIVTDGMEAAEGVVLGKTPDDNTRLWLKSDRIAKKMFNIDERSPSYKSCVSTIFHLCISLMVCDGGAYTSYAVTRRDGIMHHNSNPRFDQTFNSGTNPEFIRAKL